MNLVELVVARQAIYDREMNVIAYELLFRSSPADEAAHAALDGMAMTNSVVFSSLHIGIDALVGDKMLFCNADRDLLVGNTPFVLPPEQTVVEVLETVRPDPDVLAGCARLMAQGYRLALDDFLWFDGAEALLDIVWLVKVDIQLMTPDELTALVERLRAWDVELLAEKIETDEELAHCQELGFDYFQGYGLSRPRVVSGQTLEPSQLGAARMAASLLSSEFEVAELEAILRTDPGLAYQLLRLASFGARNGMRRTVRTLKDALVLVGPQKVQSWMAMLMLQKQHAVSDDKLALALTRARMCELLAGRKSPAYASLGFTAGMLSTFDLLIGLDLASLGDALNLDAELTEALYDPTSPVGSIIADVQEYQRHPARCRYTSGVSPADMDGASLRATLWAVQASRAF